MNKFGGIVSSHVSGLVADMRRFVKDVAALHDRPLPLARMLRTGTTIGVGFVGLGLTGHPAAAVICAIFCNLLTFVDQLGPVR